MAFSFVSLVGNTNDSVVNMIDNLRTIKSFDIADVFLIYTAKTKAGADSISVIVANKYPEMVIHLIETGYTRETVEKSLNGIIDYVRENKRGFIFSTNGGLAYMVAIIVDYIKKSGINGCVFSDADGDQCVTDIVSFKTSVFRRKLLPVREKTVEEILQEEGSNYEIIESKNNLIQFCSRKSIRLPKNCLHSVKIGETVYDLVWNNGSNRLNYLKVFDVLKLPSEKLKAARAVQLEELRDYINFQNKHLSNKQCFGFFAQQIDSERFTIETKGYGISLGYGHIGDTPSFNDEYLREKLIKFFSPEDPSLQNINSREFVINDETVVLAMDLKEILNMNLIESYKGSVKHILFCVSGEKLLRKTALYIENHISNRNGYPQIDFYYTDPFCSDIFENLSIAPGASNISVNVTPGTKGQTAVLTLWGNKNQLSVCTIDKGIIKSVNDISFAQVKYIAVDPLSLPSMQGKVLDSLDMHSEEYEKFFSTFIRILENWAVRDEDWKLDSRGTSSPYNTDLEDGTYIYERDVGYLEDKMYCMYTITTPSGERLSYPKELVENEQVRDGDFYEALIAYLFKVKAETSHCYSHIRLGYSDKVNDRIVKKGGFRTDIDVLFSKGSNYFVCECKAQSCGKVKYANQNGITNLTNHKIAKKVQTVATNVGDFVIPMIVFLNNSKDKTQISVNGVPVFILTWRDFFKCDENGVNKAVSVMMKSIDARRSTSKK